MAKNMLGIDIGSNALKLAQYDGTAVRRAISVPVPDNLVQHGNIVSFAAMSDFLKDTLREQKLRGKDCALILPASHAFLRRVTMPAMTVKQLLINLPYEFRDFLSMGKDQYYYDYAVNGLISDEEGQPQQLDLTAATVPKEVISQYRDMLRRAGLRLRTAIPAEYAYANLLRAHQAAEDREYSFLDLGHTVSRLYIFNGYRFEASRVIDVGLSSVDDAIADALGVDEHVARTYKQTNHQQAQALESAGRVYDAISLDVRKAINFYSFSNQSSNLQDLWCCGGGVHIPGLLESIAATVDLSLHEIEELLPPASGDESELSVCAAAIGAAIQ